ncbi:L,D-transpeptidase family protein [Pseudohalocynthiibacter aestuariivivens]|nr:L,D-transpeptidase family protein [Pseudohalocynthiibacter aestuariivivens]QIE45598.1 L,D-transpeptidase family protein [Pseudohalocynthiibacter aestuariivivens]
MAHTSLSRRALILGAAATGFVTPALATAQQAPVRRNTSSFVTQKWQDHFDTLGKGAIIADTTSRALHYWNADGSDYRVFPTSIPMSNELTKRGYTKIVRKKVGPTWTPTQNMRKRDPSLPTFMPAGPDNPLGTHAMYLTWPAYLIHGTHDTRKIGRRSSSGCIGLYNPMIEELFAITPIGTQVLVL